MIKIFLLFLVIFFFPQSNSASVDKLFLKSLKTSKKAEVIYLNEKKNLSDLNTVSSDIFPSLDLVGVNRYGSSDVDSENDGVDTQLSVSLNQKLFQGGAEFAINDYRKIAPRQASVQRDQSLSALYREFTTLYLKYSSAREEAKKLKVLLLNLKKRVSIVKERTRIGKDRKADLFALESQLYNLEADYIASETTLSVSENNFLNFSGLTKSECVLDTISAEKLELRQDLKLDSIPSLKSLEFDKQISEIESRIEQGKKYPQVDLDLDYFLDKTRSGTNDWEISVNLKFNIFDFGKTESLVESKKITKRIKTAQYDYAKVNSNRVWSNYLQSFESKKNQFRLVKKALLRSEASYKEQLKDLNKGLVTQIEVIRSLDDVVNLEKQAISTSTQVKILYYQAMAYLGKVPKR